jgi:LacI family transcriptional regulator
MIGAGRRRTVGRKAKTSDAAPTLKDVADRARVHVSTASRALSPPWPGRVSEATVARVQAAARELGYTPDLVAAGLKRGRTQSVGVVVGDFENPYNNLLIRGLASELETHDFIVLVTESAESRERLERVITHLLGRRVDAIVTTAAHLGDEALLQRVAAHGVPVVLGVRNLPGAGLPAVVHHDERGAALAAAHLLDLGHRVVAQLPGPLDIDSFGRRRQGFGTAVEAAEAAREVTVDAAAVVADIAEGRRLMALTLERAAERPTGVFAHNDVMAVGALEAIRAAGLSCPEDVSLVGYNDLPLASHIAPALTTVGVSSEVLGRRLAAAVLRAIEDPHGEGEVVRVDARLVVRASTAPRVPNVCRHG